MASLSMSMRHNNNFVVFFSTLHIWAQHVQVPSLGSVQNNMSTLTQLCIDQRASTFIQEWASADFFLMWSFICGFSSSQFLGDWYVWQQIHKIWHTRNSPVLPFVGHKTMTEFEISCVFSETAYIFVSPPLNCLPHSFSSECYQLHRPLSQGLYMALGTQNMEGKNNE